MVHFFMQFAEKPIFGIFYMAGMYILDNSPEPPGRPRSADIPDI